MYLFLKQSFVIVNKCELALSLDHLTPRLKKKKKRVNILILLAASDVQMCLFGTRSTLGSFVVWL